jgi:hypothetical protein
MTLESKTKGTLGPLAASKLACKVAREICNAAEVVNTGTPQSVVVFSNGSDISVSPSEVTAMDSGSEISPFPERARKKK